MYKDLHASPLQITLVIALKPMVSLFSFYWSSLVIKRRDRLVSNVIWAGILGHIPFILLFWINDPWFCVAASAIYMLLSRGVIPAWTEILKLNISVDSRPKVFAYTSSLWYLGSGLFPFFFGWLLDGSLYSWHWLFPITALLSLSAIFLQIQIPIPTTTPLHSAHLSFRNQLTQPLKNAWQLIKSRQDFSRYLVGFTLGGSGLIVLQPALPLFFVDNLNLSYVELGTAITLFKGIGYALTSPAWARWMDRVDIYRFSSAVMFIAALFPLCLICSQWNLICLYIAYLGYGFMQAGSELSWRLSGPLFAREEDSSIYSSVNVLMVGLRGCLIPPLGALLCTFGSPVLAILTGALFCLLGTLHMISCSRAIEQPVTGI
jgi:MFS family permease